MEKQEWYAAIKMINDSITILETVADTVYRNDEKSQALIRIMVAEQHAKYNPLYTKFPNVDIDFDFPIYITTEDEAREFLLDREEWDDAE